MLEATFVIPPTHHHAPHVCRKTGAWGDTTPTDPRSRRNRASRRGGQLLTRARSSWNTSACPHFVLPVPLSRMVAPYAGTASISAGRRHRPSSYRLRMPPTRKLAAVTATAPHAAAVTPGALATMKTWHAFTFLIITAIALYYAKWPILVIATIVFFCRGVLWLCDRFPILCIVRGLIRK